MDSHTFRINDNCDSVNVACCYVYVADFSWPNGYFSALGQHTHILTGFAAAKVNIKINPSNRCAPRWAIFSARMKHKMRGSQHPGKAWPMKITLYHTMGTYAYYFFHHWTMIIIKSICCYCCWTRLIYVLIFSNFYIFVGNLSSRNLFFVNQYFTFLAHLSWKLKWAFLITCCPSVCPSVNFFTFLSSSQEPLDQFQPNLGQKKPWVKGI